MALYEELVFHDILEPIMPLFERGDLRLDPKDWKIKFVTGAMAEKPWLFTRFAQDRNCFLWDFYFKNYNFIPRGCRSCWKVTCKMQSIRQLVKMEKLQNEMNLPSKCGYEMESVRWFARKGGLYSAFWYVKLDGGMEEGLRLEKVVKKKVKEVFGEDLGVKLKKGCSEMELKFGDSKSYDEIAEKLQWEGKEKLLDMFFDGEELMTYISDSRLEVERSIIRTHTLKSLIRFAAANNDRTYLDFVEKDFVPELRGYRKEDLDGNASGKHGDAEAEGGSASGKIALV